MQISGCEREYVSKYADCYVNYHSLSIISVANVTVISEGSINETRVFTVHVNQAYPLKSTQGGKITEAPEMAPVIILHTNPLCCTPCIQLTVSETYIVAGHYREHPSLQWHMPANNSLAALNSSKYIKKLSNWIAAANTHREEELANGNLS